jgi:hypothetical protein
MHRSARDHVDAPSRKARRPTRELVARLACKGLRNPNVSPIHSTSNHPSQTTYGTQTTRRIDTGLQPQLRTPERSSARSFSVVPGIAPACGQADHVDGRRYHRPHGRPVAARRMVGFRTSKQQRTARDRRLYGKFKTQHLRLLHGESGCRLLWTGVGPFSLRRHGTLRLQPAHDHRSTRDRISDRTDRRHHAFGEYRVPEPHLRCAMGGGPGNH